MFSFTQPPEIVGEFIAQKTPKLSYEFSEILHDAHKKTFTISKLLNLSLLKDVQNSLAYALHNGLNFNEWKESIKPTLIKKGWYGEVTLPDRTIKVGSPRLRTIYNTNMRAAFSVGSYKNAMDSEAPYLRYVSALELTTRPEHAMLHGTILPKNAPFWNRYYPPNGFNCKCKAIPITKSEIRARGLKIGITKTDPAPPDPGFDYNPAKIDNYEALYKETLNKIDKSTPLYHNAKKFFDNLEKNRAKYLQKSGVFTLLNALKKPFKTPLIAQVSQVSENLAAKTGFENLPITLTLKEIKEAKFKEIDIENLTEILQKSAKIYFKNDEIIFIWNTGEKQANFGKIDKSTIDLFNTRNYKLKLKKISVSKLETLTRGDIVFIETK